MPLDLKKAQASLHRTIAHLPVGSDDGQVAIEEVEIWFQPITAARIAEIDETNGDASISVIEAKTLWLSKVLVRWDIVDGKKEVKPTVDVLRTLTGPQLDALLEAVNGYTYPKKET